MSPDDAARIDPHLEPVDLAMRDRLEMPGKPIGHCYFPDSGIASAVAETSRDRRTEVGVIGREGLTGLSVVMGNGRALYQCFVQVPGHAVRIRAEHLGSAMEDSVSLRLFLLHFVQCFLLQVAHTAVANSQARLEQRLCRWILMCHDRIGSDDLPITHDFLSEMLGVRRPGVTDAIHVIEGEGLVHARRGHLDILDRDGLLRRANGLYGAPEAEYERLLGVNPARTRS